MTRLAELAQRLRELHHQAEPLVLPNAWDAATARMVQDAGFAAVATTSSGVSAALGYADGEHTPADEMFAAIKRISRVTPELPVTADIESGYQLSPEEVVKRLLDAGAVGCNLEDTDHARGGRSLVPAERQADRLAAFKQAAMKGGVDVVLNARVDIFVRGEPDVAEAIRRAKLYIQAGADSIFPIGVTDETVIKQLVEGIAAPLNVIPGFRGGPGLSRLRELGVRRMSFAGRLFHAFETDHQHRLTAIKNWQDLPVSR